MLFKRKNIQDNSEVAMLASNWWTHEIQKPYSTRRNGALSFLIKRENPLSDHQIIVFKQSLSKQLSARIGTSLDGFLRVTSDDASLIEAAHEAEIKGFPEDYFPSNVIMYIEDEDIFIHENGRKGTYLVKRK